LRVRGAFPASGRYVHKEDVLSSYWLIIYVVAFIGIFYFMAIRPQQKQRRAHQELLNTLKKGDRIGTAAGIYGTVKRVEDNIVVVEIAKGVSIKVARRAVVEILSKDSSEGRAVGPESPSRRRRAAEAETEESYDDTSAEGEEAYDDSSTEGEEEA
jgi:preprotein translocase subunit YajC